MVPMKIHQTSNDSLQWLRQRFGDHLINRRREADSPDKNSPYYYYFFIFGVIWKIMCMRTIPRQFLNWKGQLQPGYRWRNVFVLLIILRRLESGGAWSAVGYRRWYTNKTAVTKCTIAVDVSWLLQIELWWCTPFYETLSLVSLCYEKSA